MMKYWILPLCAVAVLMLHFTASAQTQTKESAKLTQDTLDGEWIMSGNWGDKMLTLNKATAKDKKEQLTPVLNTIVFEKDNNVKVNTYGEFGCGTAAIQNLDMHDTKWSVTHEGQLHLKGQYSDYNGTHTLNHVYTIVEEVSPLTLAKSLKLTRVTGDN